MTFMTGTERAERAGRDWDGLQFRVIFALLLPACLAAATLRRLAPDYWRQRGSRRSLLAEARETAGTTARFALAG